MKLAASLVAVCLLTVSCATNTPTPAPKAEAKKVTRKPYVIGEKFPSMAGRRTELIPQALPNRVRYQFSENAEVNRLADRLNVALAAADASIYGNVVMIQPGAWKLLKPRGTVGKNNAGELRMIDPKQGFNAGLESGLAGKFLRSKEDVASLAQELRTMLADDGGFEVRSFTTEEMAKWWVYIGFDIEEPVFVVATKGGRYKFIVAFVKDDHVFVVDELNALPDAT